jgi:cytochrome P450
LHRNTDIFGADADQFRPERWLRPRDEVSKMEQYSYAVSLHSGSDDAMIQSTTDTYNPSKFGGGARTCIGKHISLLEINKVVPQLLRQFDFFGADDREWTKSNRWFVKPSYQCRENVRKPTAAD